MEVVIEAGNTHLYPGSEGRITGADLALSRMSRLDCRIAFSDGGVALGSLINKAGMHWVLEVSPYTTAAGTDIGAKRWDVILRRNENENTVFRVGRKLAD